MASNDDEDLHLEAALEAQTLEDVENGRAAVTEVAQSEDQSPEPLLEVENEHLESLAVADAISEVSLIDLETDSKEKKKKQILEEISSDPYMNFPMLRDEQTIDWISRNYVMVIMRGLPGSGKSTLVKRTSYIILVKFGT
jgi:hypothetical protein